jgi:hypothetical protein
MAPSFRSGRLVLRIMQSERHRARHADFPRAIALCKRLH